MIQAETARLRNQADGIAGHKGFQVYNSLIQSSVEKIQEASKKISSSSSSSTTATTTTTTTAAEAAATTTKKATTKMTTINSQQ